MNKIKEFLAREWSMVSTKFGTILVAISSTGSVEVAPSVPLLAVPEADVKIASELHAYADTCFAWVKGLRGSGLAD